ncbi:hypothetical protein E1B28_004930 [Marasmius oreades]|uniref:N-acetyltransferase domain-containing protein n=1 Tax=Marasmius oreades TaxID=181124 RepID=A0A9P7UZP6_9AGAR|nr:uncharacterized protein E1B28_004930 [Marasmius oreades]KAG7097594.1 hypothetical protein E1B28_004930 [Marasmius oreades]
MSWTPSNDPPLVDDAQPSLPRVFLRRGLEGQDENLDGLISLYEDLQLSSVEAAREDDFLAFVENAFYFAVIHKLPVASYADPVDSDDFRSCPTFEEYKKKKKAKRDRNRKKAHNLSVSREDSTKPTPGLRQQSSSIFDNEDHSDIHHAASDDYIVTTSSDYDDEFWSAPFTGADVTPQNSNVPVSYDKDGVRSASTDIFAIEGHCNSPPPRAADGFQGVLAGCGTPAKEPETNPDNFPSLYQLSNAPHYPPKSSTSSGTRLNNLPSLEEYLNARYGPPRDSTGTGTRLGFNVALGRNPIDCPEPPFSAVDCTPYVPVPPVAKVKPYIGFVYLTRSQSEAGLLDALGMAGELNIGIILRKADRGKGYARATVIQVLKDVFEKRSDCHRIQALVQQSEEKQRVTNLYTQLQFGHEGTRRRSIFSFGEWKDITCLAILNTDWAMRGYFSPAPRTLWDEMFLRHERERDDLLRWEERRLIGRGLLQRSASMETVKDYPKDREVSSSSLSSSASGHEDQEPKRTPTPGSQSESEAEGDMLYMKIKGKNRAMDESVASPLGLYPHSTDAKGSFPSSISTGRNEYRPLFDDMEEGHSARGFDIGRTSRSSSVSSGSSSGHSFSSASVVSRPPSSSVSRSSGSEWEMMPNEKSADTQ